MDLWSGTGPRYCTWLSKLGGGELGRGFAHGREGRVGSGRGVRQSGIRPRSKVEWNRVEALYMVVIESIIGYGM